MIQRERDATILHLRWGDVPGPGLGTPLLCNQKTPAPWTTVYRAWLVAKSEHLLGRGVELTYWEEGVAICAHCARGLSIPWLR